MAVQPLISPQIVKVLIVNIGEHYFGAVINNIQDVIQRNPTTKVPLAPSNVIGLLNLRGHIVTEIDIARTLGLKCEIAAQGGYAVVVNRDGEMYSMVFEGVGDVIDIADDQIEKLPDTVDRNWVDVSLGVYRMNEKLVVLLDFDLLLEKLTPETEHV